MTVILPNGWTNFNGGGSDPALCGEPQGCPEPPCGEIPPFMVVGNAPNLSCDAVTEAIITVTGGVPPYTWSIVTGQVAFNVTVGATVTVSLIVSSYPLTKNAFTRWIPTAWSIEEVGGCGPGVSLYSADFDTAGHTEFYNCLGELICTDTSIPDCTAAGLIAADCQIIIDQCASCHNGSFAPCDGSCRGHLVVPGICSTPGNDPDMTIHAIVDPIDTGPFVCLGATFEQTFNVPVGTGTFGQAVGVGASTMMDARSEEMIENGCGCFDGTAVIQVTDYMGTQLIIVLHA